MLKVLGLSYIAEEVIVYFSLLTTVIGSTTKKEQEVKVI